MTQIDHKAMRELAEANRKAGERRVADDIAAHGPAAPTNEDRWFASQFCWMVPNPSGNIHYPQLWMATAIATYRRFTLSTPSPVTTAESGIAINQCRAGRDGDCKWKDCPQEANNRANYLPTCPLYVPDPEE